MWKALFNKWKTRDPKLPSSFDVWVFELYFARWSAIFKKYPFMAEWAAAKAEAERDDGLAAPGSASPTPSRKKLQLVVDNQPCKK